jgi:hypothetical protein
MMYEVLKRENLFYRKIFYFLDGIPSHDSPDLSGKITTIETGAPVSRGSIIAVV